MKAEILKMLRQSDGYLSGQQLCDYFQVSRTAVWKAINQLKEEGYEIEAVRNKGYRIVDIPDRITEDAIKSCLETKWMAKNLEYYDEIDSTNNRAKALGEAGGADGTLFVAETQTAGKGRRGRCWQSPAGSSISMSILLRPVMNPSDAPMLTLVMAYAATKALREKTELDIGIKWPNDLVVSGKKISGILTEMSAEIDYINHVVIGIGINVNMESFPEDIAKTATSLRIEAGKEFRRFELIAAIMEHFEKAYEAARKGIEEKTLIPWSAAPSGWLDEFYKEHGYIPALKPGEKETVADVSPWEKRQPVAVTLGTAYDEWCLSQIAAELGKKEDAEYFLARSYNYRNLFNPETRFFHPKDKDGKFIEGVDYRYSGGLGARDYYDENNGYVYRWDVQHNIGDLVSLIGGNEVFTAALDSMFDTPLGMSKWQFYSFLPDHTGNVGMFSMANEPSLHIPYLYNYAGQPWKTQKRIRVLLDQWFRNDLMGVPGDEDGGGMSAFVVFSMMGFYPVTPGSPTYNIGSPVFSDVKIDLGDGNVFEIVADGATHDNKYVQSATLNGEELSGPWFDHSRITAGGVLSLKMGPKANKKWGIGNPPPSVGPMQK